MFVTKATLVVGMVLLAAMNVSPLVVRPFPC